MSHLKSWSRRAFLGRTTVAAAATSVWSPGWDSALGAEATTPPIAVFSKVYQELKLDFEASAEVTAAAGLDGVDCAVRAGGEIPPERAADDLPRYGAALEKNKTKILLLTSGITSVNSPHAETVLRAAKKLGVRYYRLGMAYHDPAKPLAAQIAEVKAELRDLAAMNKAIGVTGVFQNHSPGGKAYFGGNLGELHELVKDCQPDEIGVAFDLGHALIVHGDDWRQHFDRLKTHFKIAYIKDTRRPRQFVPFGEGEFSKLGYFGLLKKLGYREPYSLHVEFDWAGKGNPKTKAALIKALADSRKVLQQWIVEA